MDFSSNDEYIVDEIVKGEQTFLPEMENFLVVEICKGNLWYLYRYVPNIEIAGTSKYLSAISVK